ncbi:DUF6958 family protein [Pseudooceanicola sp. MF1-13]|uniref:DUF6958 family protein n=1 Tax=Pseudooceanicola sp. MF1-13 TaxID=3379095 RepID=UPI003892B7A8
MSDKIAVENVNSPGKTTNVDAAKYTAMRDAMMTGMAPDTPMTVKEIRAGLDPHLDQTLFPGGDKAGWWLKCVQLDLEAKGILKRAPGSPVRLSKISG